MTKQRSLTLLPLTLLLLFAASARAAGHADPIFPAIGDRGYDVGHYDAALAYEPHSGVLNGTVTIEATARQSLSSFSLDLEGLQVSAVRVDGAPARFSRGVGRTRFPGRGFGPPSSHFREGKLNIATPQSIRAGEAFTAAVEYRGVPQEVTPPFLPLPNGWVRTRDGALGISTGTGGPAWLPSNNIPADKATYTFHITVPDELSAVSNGKLTGVVDEGGRKTFTWTETEPMSSYLPVVDIGRGSLEETTIDGLQSWNFVDPSVTPSVRAQLADVPEIISFESSIFGPYPFDTAGSIVDIAPLGYDEETQTRPTYLEPASGSEGTSEAPLLLVHEIAHQWFGDSVGVANWREIWLNEGFARWTEWYYAEKHGGPSAASEFRRVMRIRADVTPPPGRVRSARQIYSSGVYQRGAMTLEALRMKVGTKTMLTILRDWAEEHRYGSATTREFIALAQKVSGRNLHPLFQRFLYNRTL